MDSTNNHGFTPKFCPACGHDLANGAKFCYECGFNIMSLQQSAPIPVAEQPKESEGASETTPSQPTPVAEPIVETTQEIENKEKIVPASAETEQIVETTPLDKEEPAIDETTVESTHTESAPLTVSEVEPAPIVEPAPTTAVTKAEPSPVVSPVTKTISVDDPDILPEADTSEKRLQKEQLKAQKKAAKMEAKAAKKAKKKGKKALLIVMLAVFFLVILPVGGYAATYLIAKDKVTNQEFETANRLLFIKPLTELHDEELVKYVNAGMMMSEGNYRDAAIAFYGFKDDYYDSQSLAAKCSKKFAAELAKDENYSYELAWGNTVSTFDLETSESITLEARYHIAAGELDQITDYKKDDIVDVYNELESVYFAGYEDAYGAYAESKAGNALHTVYQAYADRKAGDVFHEQEDIFLDYALKALSDISEVKDYNSKTASINEELNSYIYKIAMDDFDEGYYQYAYEYFIKLGSYSYATEYATVCDDLAIIKESESQSEIDRCFQDAFSYSEIVPNIASVIYTDNDLFDRFMLGTWKSSSGSEYYTLEVDSAWRHYTFDTNLPIIDHEYNESYSSNNHRLFVGNRKCFTFNITSFGTISIDCEKNGKSYVLYRME